MYNYDEQIETLTKEDNERSISSAWGNGQGLFKFLHPNDNCAGFAGCPTMVKRGKYHVINLDGSYNSEFEERIKNDENIPEDIDDITEKHLLAFKKVQEEYDAMIEEQKEALK